jgi:DNA-directed RNA polymerase specialized sigma24 family protein
MRRVAQIIRTVQDLEAEYEVLFWTVVRYLVRREYALQEAEDVVRDAVEALLRRVAGGQVIHQPYMWTQRFALYEAAKRRRARDRLARSLIFGPYARTSRQSRRPANVSPEQITVLGRTANRPRIRSVAAAASRSQLPGGRGSAWHQRDDLPGADRAGAQAHEATAPPEPVARSTTSTTKEVSTERRPPGRRSPLHVKPQRGVTMPTTGIEPLGYAALAAACAARVALEHTAEPDDAYELHVDAAIEAIQTDPAYALCLLHDAAADLDTARIAGEREQLVDALCAIQAAGVVVARHARDRGRQRR